MAKIQIEVETKDLLIVLRYAHFSMAEAKRAGLKTEIPVCALERIIKRFSEASKQSDLIDAVESLEISKLFGNIE